MQSPEEKLSPLRPHFESFNSMTQRLAIGPAKGWELVKDGRVEVVYRIVVHSLSSSQQTAWPLNFGQKHQAENRVIGLGGVVYWHRPRTRVGDERWPKSKTRRPK